MKSVALMTVFKRLNDDTYVELAGLPAPPTSHTLHLYPFHLFLPFPFPDYTAGDLEMLPGLYRK